MASIAKVMTDDLALLQHLLERLATEHRLPPPGAHAELVGKLRGQAEDLTACAVIADRRIGATWEQIGAGLSMSGEAARGRYGHRHLTDEWPLPLPVGMPKPWGAPLPPSS